MCELNLEMRMDIKSKIRTVPDFPKKGIIFKVVGVEVLRESAIHLIVEMMWLQYGIYGFFYVLRSIKK